MFETLFSYHNSKNCSRNDQPSDECPWGNSMKLAYKVGLRDGKKKSTEGGMNSADIWKNANPKVMSMVTVMNNTVRPLSTKREFGVEGTIEGHTRTRFPGKPAE